MSATFLGGQADRFAHSAGDKIRVRVGPQPGNAEVDGRVPTSLRRPRRQTSMPRLSEVDRFGSELAQPPADLGGKALEEFGVVCALRRLPHALVETVSI